VRTDSTHDSGFALRPSHANVTLRSRRSGRPARTDRAHTSGFALRPERSGGPNLPGIAFRALRSDRSFRSRLTPRALQTGRSGTANIPFRPGRPIGTWGPRRPGKAGWTVLAFRARRAVSARIALCPLRSNGADSARLALGSSGSGRTLRSLLTGLALTAPFALGASCNREHRRKRDAGDSQAHWFSPRCSAAPLAPDGDQHV
jgi:hypothetical protein